MTSPQAVSVPQQDHERGLPAPDDVEQAAARTADLVLKLTALAERYEGGAGSAERAALMRDVAGRGRMALASLVEPVDG